MQATSTRRAQRPGGRDLSAWLPAARFCGQDYIGAREERALELCESIIDVAAALFNVSGKEMRKSGRSRLDVARVRQIAMYVAHVTLRLSMTDIGRGFGRDRTTVLHACHLIEDLRDDADFDSVVAATERVALAAFGNRITG